MITSRAPFVAATQEQIAAGQAHTAAVRGIIAGLLFRAGQLSEREDAAYEREDSITGNLLLQRLAECAHAARVLARANGIYL